MNSVALIRRTLCVIGMGYVGLPLALAFARVQSTLENQKSRHQRAGKCESSVRVIGFDIDAQRIRALREGLDHTAFADQSTLAAAQVEFTDQPEHLSAGQVFIVTVPTPVTAEKLPDLSPVASACQLVARKMRAGAVVIFESTVYPGCTEEFCVPLLEQLSGLRYNQEFFVGYSPERINPGDTHNTLQSIVKVTSGSTPEIAEAIAELYRQIVSAGVFPAASIATAEASKVIENVQRDVNIALINEFSQICHHLQLDTHAVLAAARSKWNFLDFRPGLVGGHCIGVDPYYLIHRSQQQGFVPQLIATARQVNEGMSAHVVSAVLKLCARFEIPEKSASVLILGVSFKENCADIRNSRVFDIAAQLQAHGAQVQLWDPVVATQLGATLHLSELGQVRLQAPHGCYDVVILAVPHHELVTDLAALQAFRRPGGVFYDVKGVLPNSHSNGRL